MTFPKGQTWFICSPENTAANLPSGRRATLGQAYPQNKDLEGSIIYPRPYIFIRPPRSANWYWPAYWENFGYYRYKMKQTVALGNFLLWVRRRVFWNLDRKRKPCAARPPHCQCQQSAQTVFRQSTAPRLLLSEHYKPIVGWSSCKLHIKKRLWTHSSHTFQ